MDLEIETSPDPGCHHLLFWVVSTFNNLLPLQHFEDHVEFKTIETGRV